MASRLEWIAKFVAARGDQMKPTAIFPLIFSGENRAFGNAVGTAVAGGPPHRSVREGLPHTAPPLSNDGHDVSIATCRACWLALKIADSGTVSGATTNPTWLLFGDSSSRPGAELRKPTYCELSTWCWSATSSIISAIEYA